MAFHTRAKWVHDCDMCKFIGRFENKDVYLCDKATYVEVVIRYGSEGAEYHSWTSFKNEEPKPPLMRGA